MPQGFRKGKGHQWCWEGHSQNAGWESGRRHCLVLFEALSLGRSPTLGPYCMHNLPPGF
jgi:hypothetical protein